MQEKKKINIVFPLLQSLFYSGVSSFYGATRAATKLILLIISYNIYQRKTITKTYFLPCEYKTIVIIWCIYYTKSVYGLIKRSRSIICFNGTLHF